MTRSALYEGWVGHRRHDPVEHAFRYPLFMACLDLDELPWVLDPFPGWSARRPALAWFRRSDYLGAADRPLADCVRDAVRERGGAADGPISLLTNLRYAGHSFNPVSFYYCYDRAGERVLSVLAEVSNTPWGERHSYLLTRDDDGAGMIRAEVPKEFHVSPLMGMEQTYDWRTSEPDQSLTVHIASHGAAGRTFDATLRLERREMAPRTMRRVLLRYPVMTAQVVARIYLQALRLRLKGAPYHPHPGTPEAGGHGA